MTIEYKDSKRIVANEADVAVVSNRGTIDTTSSSGNTIITFTGNGTFTPTSAFNVETIVVAGGGGGGSGGGGAGGIVYDAVKAVTAKNYDITIGAGGTAGWDAGNGGQGEDSVFDNITSLGGGAGMRDNNNGSAGGSGAGGSATSINVGAGGASTQTASGGDTGYGNAGGSSSNSSPYPSSGGGGAGAAGGNGSGSVCGSGGIGIVNPISGSTTGESSGGSYYLGGGGGGGRSGATQGTGGTGGGGNGSGSTTGEAGTANTGGGGGGSYGSSGTGVGGSGVVIIKFATSGNTYSTSAGGKPTDVQDNSILVEKDTAKRYWFDAESSVDATFTSDFSSSTGWTSTGSTPAVNTGTEKIDFEAATSADIKSQLTYDLTSTSDTKWILRCKLNVTTFTQPTTEYHRFFIGLSSSTSNLNTSEDAIGLKYELGTGSLDRLVAIDTNGSAIRATTGDNFTHTSAVETLYVEIIRQSATTYDVNLRTGSHSGTLVEGKTGLTVSASTTGLQYLKIGSYSDNAGNGELSGTIDDVKFYNDITSVTTPATWTMQPKFNSTISSTSTLGSSGNLDTDYGTVYSKTATGVNEKAWEYNGTQVATKGVTNSDFSCPSSSVWSCAGWFRLNSIGSIQPLFGFAGGLTGTHWAIVKINANNKLSFRSQNNGVSAVDIETTNIVTTDTWHHFVGIHDGTTHTVYLDGNTSSKGTGTGASGSASTGNWSIGMVFPNISTPPTLDGSLDGRIDELTWWNTALTESEVGDLYNNGSATSPNVKLNNVLAYWTMEQTGALTNQAV